MLTKNIEDSSENDREEIINKGTSKINCIQFNDRKNSISHVASERSFFDYVKTNLNLGDFNFLKKKRASNELSSSYCINKKKLIQKSDSGVTLMCVKSAKASASTLKKGFSASDSMLQLSGRVYINYQRILNKEYSSTSPDTGSNKSSSISSDCSIYSSFHDSSESTSSSSLSSSELSAPEPPDGGWGWIVVVAAFFVQMITDGVPVSFGIFLNDFLEDFNQSLSVTSWVGSLIYGIPSLAAPLSSILINRFGCRKVCVVGGIISAVGCGLSFFANSMLGLILTFGILSGIGSSMSSTAALIIVSVYFDDRRATATGLSIAGTGVGALVFAPLVYWLISLYTWRGAMLILSGLFANLVVCGVLMRPVETGRERRKRQLLSCMESFAKESGFRLPEVYLKSEDKKIDYRILLLRKLLTNPINLDSPDSLSQLSLPLNIPKSNITQTKTNSFHKTQRHVPAKTSPKCSLDCITEECVSYVYSLNQLNLIQHLTDTNKNEKQKSQFSSDRRNTSPAYKLKTQTIGLQMNENCNKNITSFDLLSTSEPIVYKADLGTDLVHRIRRPCVHKRKSNEKDAATLAAINQQQEFCFIPHRVANLLTVPPSLTQIQPLYSRTKRSIFHRTTVFHSSTEHQLRTVLSMPELASASHVASSSYLNNSSTPQNCLTIGIKRGIDLSLFHSLDFNIFLVSNLLLYFWCNITYFFIAIYAETNGISSTLAAMLFSIMGASDMVGEVAFGWAADQKWFNTLILYTSAVLVCGVSTIFVPFATSFTPLVIYSLIFGFTMAANDSLCTVLVIEFVGLSRLVNGLGFCLFCQGMATIFGPPVIGFIMDASGSHAVAFVVCGVGVACAALVMFPVIVRERRHKAAKRRRREVRLLLSTSSSGNAAPIAIDA